MAIDPKAIRAARLSRIPGVTIAQAAKRFEVPPAQVSRARKSIVETSLSMADLALAALTREGRRRSGALSDLKAIAGWLDYVNHDACTPAEVRALLDEQVKAGLLEIDGGRRLLKPWP